METQSLIIYYPAARADNARRVAERVEGCAAALRKQARIHNAYADQKMVMVVPDVPFNNAFVVPPLAGVEAVSVTPTSNTLDFASELGVPPDPSYVGCHEIVHYVHMLQVTGMWGWINRWLGHAMSPQLGFDPWFTEGLATYYESRLQPGTGRMAWPAWRGMFHAGFAGKRISGGDFSVFHRPFHWGNHYLVGSHFVEWIAERYGEAALWKLIGSQGDAFLFPFAVALRWKSATGKTLPTLIDEFAGHVARHYPKTPRPTGQTSVRGAGTAARYAVAATGREALILSSGDLPTRLRIYDGDRLVRDRGLTDVAPPRTLAVADPIGVSGLSFTADGDQLYFVSLDAGATLAEARLLRYDVGADDLSVVVPRLGGPGGGISGDGTTYYYAYADGDRHHLAALDVATGQARMVRRAGPRGYYGPARPSPDGRRVASALFDGQRFVLRVVDATSGKTVAQADIDGALHDPSWVDDRRLIVLGEHDGRFQVHLYDVDDDALERVTDAPYLAFQPRVRGGAVRFLNRDGWGWTVDEVALAAVPDVKAPPVGQPLPDLPYAGPGGSRHATAPGVAASAPAFRALDIVSEAPYSQTDGLFRPTLHTPFIFNPEIDVALFGLALAGGDRLSFHRWTLFGLYDVQGGEVSGGLSYANAMLAPWFVRVDVDRFAWDETDTTSAGPFREERRARVAVGRTVRTTTVEVSMVGVEDREPGNPRPVFGERRLAGPGVDLVYSAVESTPYAGARRGLAVAASAAYYDSALSTLDDTVADVRGAVGLAAPLPLWSRHTLGVEVRGRRLLGLDRDRGFLVVGGGGGVFESVWERSDGPEYDDIEFDELSPQLEFTEPLRGFEDLPLAVDRIAIGELTYRLPVIIDRGYSSFAYLLPSLFLRQIDFELFAVGATDSFVAFDDRRHLAVGGSVSVAAAVWLLPVSVRYQLARRLTDDDALVHSIQLGLGL